MSGSDAEGQLGVGSLGAGAGRALALVGRKYCSDASDIPRRRIFSAHLPEETSSYARFETAAITDTVDDRDRHHYSQAVVREMPGRFWTEEAG